MWRSVSKAQSPPIPSPAPEIRTPQIDLETVDPQLRQAIRQLRIGGDGLTEEELLSHNFEWSPPSPSEPRPCWKQSHLKRWLGKGDDPAKFRRSVSTPSSNAPSEAMAALGFLDRFESEGDFLESLGLGAA